MKNKKRIKRAIALLIIAAIGAFVWSKWDRWFHNPPEAPYAVSAEPQRLLLTFGDEDGVHSRNVSWMADTVVRQSSLELVDLTDGDSTSVSAEGETFRSRSGIAAYYVARLRGLAENHRYRYRVCTDGRYSPWHEFATHEAGSDKAAFLFVGDVQDTIAGVANQLLRRALAKNPEVEFLVSGGDHVERPTDAYWAEGFRGLDSIAQAMPVLTITGNHDYLKYLIRKLERRFTLTHSYFLDSKIDDNHVYDVRYGSYLEIFALDSNRELPFLLKQAEWLEERLEESTAKWKVVLMHHPIHSVKRKSNNAMQRFAFEDLLLEYGVDLVLQGHEHAYARVTNGGATPVYTISHCSPKNYRITNDAEFEKVGLGSRYYQKVSINADTMTVTAYDANSGELYDSLRVVKQPHGAPKIEDFGNRFKTVIVRE